MNVYVILGADHRTVVNVIVASPDVAAQNYVGAIQIDNLDPMPGIGWFYHAGVFSKAGR